MANVNAVAAYQQANQIWNNNKKTEETKKADVAPKTESEIKKALWSPIDTRSTLVPTNKEGIGMSIGDVSLSDAAKDYYSKLKAKFGNMEFIAVSKDMKEQVKANAAAYGNANKMVVLIDDEKLERMATDESYRKKYEGIISMSQMQLNNAKNSLASSGANIKNFGMSVNEDGTTSFFATLEKSSADQAKRIEKKQAEKKAAKAKEKKLDEKKAQEKRLEKAKEEKKSEKAKLEEKLMSEDKEYVKLEASSWEDLINQVSKFAYDNSANSVMTDAEKMLGQNIDFAG